MLFNSYVFIFVFMPITLIGFYGFALTGKSRLSTAALTLCSLGFYAYWRPVYLPLLMGSICVNYWIGRRLAQSAGRSRSSATLLSLGVFLNLLIIAYYKYADFLASSLLPNSVSAALNSSLGLDSIMLPLAISFFTFQQIAYLADAFQGEGKEYSLLDYCLFVSFFPQLIAGPIVHHNQVVPQFRKAHTFLINHRNISLGLTAFILGLAKKVLIADNLSPWVAQVFSNANDVAFLEAWVGALAYTFQLYFDFSGYSDMAIGLGLLFNIKLLQNFNSPYKAKSITEFWRRWHITLSNFLRDYLYITLGGNRKGEARRYLNLMITMLLGGLWHGAGWTFVLWGGLHGIYLCINHCWGKLKPWTLPGVVSWGLTFLSVVASWVLFRATSIQDGAYLLQTMAGFHGITFPGEAGGKLSFLTDFGFQLRSWNDLAYMPQVLGSKAASLGVLFGLLFVTAKMPNVYEIMSKLRPNWIWAAWIGFLGSICLLSLNRVSEFLYFQF
jgi:alginate O-acetyltransferase complex protein AlgI